MVHIFIKVWHVMTCKVFSKEKPSQAGQKTTKYWYKIFSLKHILRFWIQKKCISKLSTKMFIKRKTRRKKSYAHQILGGFRTSVIYKKLTSRRTIVSAAKQLSPEINRFFAGYCPTSGVNIQVCASVQKSGKSKNKNNILTKIYLTHLLYATKTKHHYITMHVPIKIGAAINTRMLVVYKPYFII